MPSTNAKFLTNTLPTTVKTQNSVLLAVLKSIHRTTGDKSFSCSTHKLWNSLSVDVRKTENLTTSKCLVRRILFNEIYKHLKTI